MSPATLDTPAARARSVRRALEARSGIHLEQRFRDGAGEVHEIRSCPVPGGRYLYDASPVWGLRTIGLCQHEDGEHLAALSEDYARCCGERLEPMSRELRLSDILRRRGAETEGEE